MAEFNYIECPETGKKFLIYGKEGRTVLANYLKVNKQMTGGLRKINKNCKISVEKSSRNPDKKIVRCRRSRGRGNLRRCKRGKKGHCKKRSKKMSNRNYRRKQRSMRKANKSKKRRRSSGN